MTAAVSPDDIANAVPAEDATIWDRRMRALTLRNAGATYAKIAQTLQISQERARQDVNRAIKEVVKLPVDQMVDRQRAILLDITRRNYTAALDGDREAQGVIIRCLEHEAKLYGLYAPARVSIGISEAEFGQQAADLLKLVGTGPLAELAGTSTSPDIAEALKPHAAPEKDESPKSDDVIEGEVIEDDEPWSNI